MTIHSPDFFSGYSTHIDQALKNYISQLGSPDGSLSEAIRYSTLLGRENELDLF